MRHRNLLNAIMLSVITLAAANNTYAQQDAVTNANNTVMNKYSYAPQTFQRGSSTSEVRLFPNPARSQATLYINSIKEEDRGDLVIYNNSGKVVQRIPVMPGNNDVNVASFSTGIYNVVVYFKDRAIYKQQLVVTK